MDDYDIWIMKMRLSISQEKLKKKIGQILGYDTL